MCLSQPLPPFKCRNRHSWGGPPHPPLPQPSVRQKGAEGGATSKHLAHHGAPPGLLCPAPCISAPWLPQVPLWLPQARKLPGAGCPAPPPGPPPDGCCGRWVDRQACGHRGPGSSTALQTRGLAHLQWAGCLRAPQSDNAPRFLHPGRPFPFPTFFFFLSWPPCGLWSSRPGITSEP